MGKEQSYSDRLNIPVISVGEAKDIVKDEISQTVKLMDQGTNFSKQTFRLVGPAGIGKTAICSQITSELSDALGIHFDMIKVQSPVLSRDDFLVPFPNKNGNGEVDSFKMLYSNFVPTDENSYGLFVIDELSRGDHQLQQLMWQVENENAIHVRNLPKGWFVISLDNPDESEYSLDTLEDAAGIRRKAQFYVNYSPREFLSYAKRNNFYEPVVDYFSQYSDRIYDEESQKQGMVYTNPASIERFSEKCWKYYLVNSGVEENQEKLRKFAESLFNRNAADPLMDFIIEREKQLNPQDIVHSFEKIKPHIEQMVKDNDNARLSELVTGLIYYMAHQKPVIKHEEYEGIIDFLTMIPIDTAAMFISETDKFNHNSEEFACLAEFHVYCAKHFPEKYKKNFLDKMEELSEDTEE